MMWVMEKDFLDYLPRQEVTDKQLSLCLYCSDATHDLTYSVNHLQMWSIIVHWHVITENITSFIKITL